MSSISLVSSSNGNLGVSVNASTLFRAAPEPRNSLGSAVKSLAATGAGVVGDILPGVNPFLGTGLEDMLNQQMQIQLLMQDVSMRSNILRSQHEMEMAPIRNMRLG
jgi:hypothetical protein